jgi:hypothetical protein
MPTSMPQVSNAVGVAHIRDERALRCQTPPRRLARMSTSQWRSRKCGCEVLPSLSLYSRCDVTASYTWRQLQQATTTVRLLLNSFARAAVTRTVRPLLVA